MHNVILIGAGPLGLKVSEYILDRPNLRLVGVVDLNPDLHGARISDLIEGITSDVIVSKSVDDALARTDEKPHVAVVTTVSSIQKMIPTIRLLAERDLSIVTTCEEMSYPWRQHPDEAAEIDRICKTNGVACLGTGVNPGYLMDYLAAVLTSVNQRVDTICVERVQDASVRRVPFQKKIGAGLSREEFEVAKHGGTLRHVGLPESLDMIAAAMEWDLDESSESLEPVLASADCDSGYRPIRKGEPAGVEQIATGRIADREVIRLRFRAAVGEEKSYDRVAIKGLPGLQILIPGGVNGDIATSAITVNAIGSVLRTTPGLRTMLDVPAPAWSGGAAARAATT